MCQWGQTKDCRVWIPARDSHTGTGRWAIKAVDACIADQVNALNAAGRLTRFSCCGHGKRPGEIVLLDGTVIEVESGVIADKMAATKQ